MIAGADVLDEILEEQHRAQTELREPFAIALTLAEAAAVLERAGAGWIGLPTLIYGVKVQIVEYCRRCRSFTGLRQLVEGPEDGVVYCPACGIGRDPEGYFSRAPADYGARIEWL